MMRLDKMLAHLGYGSRKEVKERIRKGYVLVNGCSIVDDDYKVDEEQDEIIFLGEEVYYEKLIYLVMNKPKGVVSATTDKERTVLDLIEGYEHRGLFPVGRLDKDTTGLLILSNDGKLAHQLLSPTHHVSKCYQVWFNGDFQDSFIEQFQKGIVLEDGTLCLPAFLKLISKGVAKIEITEGKFHQVKRMFASVNLEVTDLKRISFGGLELPKDLVEGSYRAMTNCELEQLKQNKVLSK